MYVIGILSLMMISLVVGVVVQYKLINNDSGKSLISAPSFRRRHRSSTPLTGGIGIFITFILASFSVAPYFETSYLFDLIPISLGLGFVFAVGLIDDIYTLRPKVKLLGELVAACIVLLSPSIQEFALGWQNSIGIAIWPLIVFWLVGVTNAINLIDGLDGLASYFGVSTLLVLLSICMMQGFGGQLQIPLIGAMIASLIPFIIFNRHPAKVFLGDNGSLVLGLFIATMALLKPPAMNGWSSTLSIIAIAGYPLLDMGWVTYTRIRKGFSPFTADRSHIHYRLLKFKLSVHEVVGTLMVVNLAFLMTSFLLTRSTVSESLFIVCSLFVSCYVLLKLVNNFDRWKNSILAESPQRPHVVDSIPQKTQAVLVIDIRPIFTALDSTDQKLIEGALDSLNGHLAVRFQRKDGHHLLRKRAEIFVTTESDPDTFFNILSESIRDWLQFYDIAISLPNLPVTIVESQNWPESQKTPKAA